MAQASLSGRVQPAIDLRQQLANRDPETLLSLANEMYGVEAAIVTSFQVEGMVLLDMAAKVAPELRVITVDTGRLPPETHTLIDDVREKYGVNVEIYYPEAETLNRFTSTEGANAFYRSPQLRLECCRLRKVNPLDAVLRDLSLWITGVRRSQTPSRRSTHSVELDSRHGGIWKLNPLADWSEEQVWSYVSKHQVPANRLYDKGYRSIGCDPCTRAVRPGEDIRSGRWWWERETPKECGIHGNGMRSVASHYPVD